MANDKTRTLTNGHEIRCVANRVHRHNLTVVNVSVLKKYISLKRPCCFANYTPAAEQH
jgi:hypothetical protein